MDTYQRMRDRVTWFGAVIALWGWVAIAPMADISFTEMSDAAGVNIDTYKGDTNHILGVAWIDFNKDGWPDIFAVNGFGRTAHLFENNQDGTFTVVDGLLPALPNIEMSQAHFADFDNDGDSDLYIWAVNEIFEPDSANFKEDGPANILLKNMWVENGNQVIAGQPLFTDVAAAAGVDHLANPSFGTYPGHQSISGGWLDYDRDGCVDLYVANYVIRHKGFEGNIPALFRNKCDGTFENTTVPAGINDGVDPESFRPALAVLTAHLDGDLNPDIWHGTVSERSDPLEDPVPETTPERWYDFIYHNNGDGTFTDIRPTMPGVGDDAAAVMGMDVADIDLDGDWDLYMSDVFTTQNDALPLGNPLYLGNGDGTFQDNTAVCDCNDESADPADHCPVGEEHTSNYLYPNCIHAGVAARFSWGTSFFDADQDGDEDLYVAADSRDFMYRNVGNGRFQNVAQAAGIGSLSSGRGSATADYDRDGDLDVLTVEQGSQIYLYRNDSTNAGHWLQLKLQANESNRDAIGTVVKIQAGSLTMMRQVKGGSSAHSQDDLVVHFGLADATSVDKVVVCWPGDSSGAKVDVLTNLAADTLHTVVEGANAQNVACDLDASPALAVDSISPSTIGRGTEQVFTVMGQSFDPGINAIVLNSALTPVTNIQFVDGTQLNVTINADAGAMLGSRTMGFRNPDDESVQVQAAFEVIIAPLEVTNVTPDTIAQGATEVFTIAGAGFVEGTAVRILNSPNTSVDNVAFVDGNALSVTITADPATALGPKRIRVRNPDGETVVVTNAITVVAP